VPGWLLICLASPCVMRLGKAACI